MALTNSKSKLFSAIQATIEKRNQIIANENPEYTPTKTKSRSLFLTEFDRMEKTKALWRNLKPVQKRTNSIQSVSSLSDLDKLKNKYRTELLRKKSKDQIFQENMKMILKIQQTAPKVEPWNHYKPKKSKRSSFDEDLLMKNMQLIKKIEETEPKVQNWNYYKPKKSPRAQQRSQEKLKIFQQNLKIIDKVQSAPPKVESWSYFKPRRNKMLTFQRKLYNERIFQQNMKIIEKVQSIPPKVESWADIKTMRKKIMNKKLQQNRSSQKIEKLKRIIQQAEQKFQKSSELSNAKNRRMKTLPEKTSSRSLQQRGNHQIQVKRLQLKIKKSKCSIDCWPKGVQPLKIKKIQTKQQVSVDRKPILSTVGKIKQAKRLNKNMQINNSKFGCNKN